MRIKRKTWHTNKKKRKEKIKSRKCGKSRKWKSGRARRRKKE